MVSRVTAQFDVNRSYPARILLLLIFNDIGDFSSLVCLVSLSHTKTGKTIWSLGLLIILPCFLFTHFVVKDIQELKKDALEMESCCFARAVFKIRNILAAAAYTAEITDEVTALGRSKSLSKIFNEDYINSKSLSQSFYVDVCK